MKYSFSHVANLGRNALTEITFTFDINQLPFLDRINWNILLQSTIPHATFNTYAGFEIQLVEIMILLI